MIFHFKRNHNGMRSVGGKNRLRGRYDCHHENKNVRQNKPLLGQARKNEPFSNDFSYPPRQNSAWDQSASESILRSEERNMVHNYRELIEEKQIKEADAMRLLQQIRREVGFADSVVQTGSYSAQYAAESGKAEDESRFIRSGKKSFPYLAAAAVLMLLVGFSLVWIMSSPRPPQSNLPVVLQKRTEKEKDGHDDKKMAAGKASQTKKVDQSEDQNKSKAGKAQAGASAKAASQGTASPQNRQGQEVQISEKLAMDQNSMAEPVNEGVNTKQADTERKQEPQSAQNTGNEAAAHKDSGIMNGPRIRPGQDKVILQCAASQYALESLGKTQVSIENQGAAIEYADEIMVQVYNEQSGEWQTLSALVANRICVEGMYALNSGESKTLDVDLSLYINRAGSYRLALSYNLAADRGTSLTAYSESFEVR